MLFIVPFTSYSCSASNNLGIYWSFSFDGITDMSESIIKPAVNHENPIEIIH